MAKSKKKAPSRKVAKKKARAKKATAKRPVGRPKAPTLKELSERVEKFGEESLNDGEMAMLERMRNRLNKRKKKQVIRLPTKFDISSALESAVPRIFKALMEEAINGKGIARISAAKVLKDWAREEVAPDEDEIEVGFDITGMGPDGPDEPNEAETA